MSTQVVTYEHEKNRTTIFDSFSRHKRVLELLNQCQRILNLVFVEGQRARMGGGI
jgi:hypothetical protein